ncbi:glutaredoxin family protein [Actinomadura algeriensis]|uniref:Glutaredoxin n=1 Tax=Actinomadura algeriensis TaxID=1679523 RepID=A0ABR9JMB7_9ACTN|nr:glutaredoxin family protein [Actinomadura algeriensis]MBE1531697.1 glutaredoxin [Actinomadura algeriensis]
MDAASRPSGSSGEPSGSSGEIVVTLLGKPGCHLCDDARAIIGRVAGELGVRVEERDITASEEDTRLYWEQIPVTLINGVQHDFWRVDENRLRNAITELRERR